MSSRGIDDEEEERQVQGELIQVVRLLTVPLLGELSASHRVGDSLEDEEGDRNGQNV